MKRPAEIPTTRSSDYSIIVGNPKNRQEIQTAKTPEAKAGFQIHSVSLWLTYSRSAESGQSLGP